MKTNLALNFTAPSCSDTPRDSRPRHQFSLGSPEAVAKARNAYKRYQDYFHVSNEE